MRIPGASSSPQEGMDSCNHIPPVQVTCQCLLVWKQRQGNWAGHVSGMTQSQAGDVLPAPIMEGRETAIDLERGWISIVAQPMCCIQLDVVSPLVAPAIDVARIAGQDYRRRFLVRTTELPRLVATVQPA